MGQAADIILDEVIVVVSGFCLVNVVECLFPSSRSGYKSMEIEEFSIDEFFVVIGDHVVFGVLRSIRNNDYFASRRFNLLVEKRNDEINVFSE